MRQISYSQNFIKNRKLLESLIKASGITKEDLVLDLGAGTGEITEILRKYCKKVIAVEKSKKLYDELKRRFKLAPDVSIVNQDILKYDFPDNENYKIFSNIPFNYTADIIRKLCEQKNLADDIYLFLQKQASLKYVGHPYSNENLKSLFIKTKFVPSLIHNFKRNDFSPSPRVEVVLFRLKKLKNPLVIDTSEMQWKDFVVYGFSQFASSLKEGFKQIFTDRQFQRLSKDLKFNVNSKPTELSVYQWVSLFIFFESNIEARKKYLIKDSYANLMKQQNLLSKIHRTRVDKSWRSK